MSNRGFAVALAALLSASAVAGSVQAADPGFCRDYATAAINQSRGARAHERCDRFIRADPARWNMDWRAHYDWCTSVSRRDAERERDARTAALNECARR